MCSLKPIGSENMPEVIYILLQFEYSSTFSACKISFCILYVGESGVVYKGYIDTSLGSELVAIKTVKGIKNCAGLDCVKTCHVYIPSNM